MAQSVKGQTLDLGSSHEIEPYVGSELDMKAFSLPLPLSLPPSCTCMLSLSLKKGGGIIFVGFVPIGACSFSLFIF